MTPNPKIALRLQFLTRVVRKECQHLVSTDQRLFGPPFTEARASQLETDPDLADQVETFVGGGRLQDTLGDELLPMLLMALGETPAAACDNMDRAGPSLLDSADEWITMHQLETRWFTNTWKTSRCSPAPKRRWQSKIELDPISPVLGIVDLVDVGCCNNQARQSFPG